MVRWLMLLAGVMCALVYAFTALTYAFFWYETASGPHRNRLEERFHGKTGKALLKILVFGPWRVMLLLLFYPLGYWKRLWQIEPVPGCKLPPVLLVHGLYHNAGAWWLYRRWLKKAGFRNVSAFTYNSWTMSFHDILKELDRQVLRLAEIFPGRGVILVGHSLGGLLSRAYVECSVEPSEVQAVVTLGTPHQGSKLAALGMGRLAQSLLHRGPLVEWIERESKDTDVPRLAIHSPVDNMVLPNEALKIPYEGWEYRESPPVSHVAMLAHKPTADLAIQYLLLHFSKS